MGMDRRTDGRTDGWIDTLHRQKDWQAFADVKRNRVSFSQCLCLVAGTNHYGPWINVASALHTTQTPPASLIAVQTRVGTGSSRYACMHVYIYCIYTAQSASDLLPRPSLVSRSLPWQTLTQKNNWLNEVAYKCTSSLFLSLRFFREVQSIANKMTPNISSISI